MRTSRSDPTAISNRVTNAAPLRQRFSQDVSSSKLTPRLSRPRTLNGRRTEMRRSDRCFDMGRLAVTIGRFLLYSNPKRIGIAPHAGVVLEKALYAFQHFRGGARRVHFSTKLAAVPKAMRKPASELLHFANSVGKVGVINFSVVPRK